MIFPAHNNNCGNSLQDIDISKPFILSNVIDVETRREWWKHIQTRSRNELVQLERQHAPAQSFTDTTTANNPSTTNNDHHDDFVEEKLIHALELLQNASENEPLYVTSMGSSCSMDQIPVYEYCQSLFPDDEVDVLADFSRFTPVHESLVLSCHHAVSTLCCRAHTSIILNVGGGSVDWCVEAFSPDDSSDNNVPDTQLHNSNNNIKNNYDSYAVVTRTWSGHEFSLGWNSPCCYFEQPITEREKGDEETTRTRTRFLLTSYPGDVLVIPSFWWYQSRAQGPANISIHSKRCGAHEELVELLRFITETHNNKNENENNADWKRKDNNGGTEEVILDIDNYRPQQSPQERIATLFRQLET